MADPTMVDVPGLSPTLYGETRSRRKVDRTEPPPVIVQDERAQRQPQALEALWASLQAQFVPHLTGWRLRRLRRILPLVERAADVYAAMDDADLRNQIRRHAANLRRQDGFERRQVGDTFALIREISARQLGQRHYNVQILGAYAMLRGMLAEMATGEGKTLTAALAAGTAALAGRRVHVVTVNDYLAARDAETLAPLYNALGLTVGTVTSAKEDAERRQSYRCDIVYCTNKDLTFDYLRDRIEIGQDRGNSRLKLDALGRSDPKMSRLRLQGLDFAIVDEADSVLIDEARTPLIISAPAQTDPYARFAQDAMILVGQLLANHDFVTIASERRVVLTARGRDRVRDLTQNWPSPWTNKVLREELVHQALAATYLFHRDEHYLVRDGKIAIVDEYTGRVMPDRIWGSGLHQMIEFKEGCDFSQSRNTIARITYQKFFRRYRLLGGMSGTLRPVASEMWNVYRLPVAAIPTHRPLRRITLPDRVFPTQTEKWQAVAARAADLAASGCAVLIGTRSVAASQRAGSALEAIGIDHVILNANQDKREAEIVAEAGRPGRVTVATNMAARGTDIKVAPEALARGGLHVIMTERHDARRIDRQLAGRCARQGEPGCFEAFLSLEDPLMTQTDPSWSERIINLVLHRFGDSGRRLAIRKQQSNMERLHARMRASLLKNDQQQRHLLAFSGESE